MQFISFIQFLDFFGSFVFALSGAIVASRKGMDILGMLVLAVVTAVGGGTLRSILIGDAPVPFLKDYLYLTVCILAVLIVFYFKRFLLKIGKPMIFCDAIGLGIFVSIGISVALDKGLSPWASLLMGVITGSFGGVIRDVLSNEIPLIFQKEIYATACLIGGGLFLVLRQLNAPEEIIVYISAFTVFGVRLIAVKLGLSLPRSK
ncbi:MAG: trimeric intracellular cation channel family protein [Candidatus Caenarcaniphilales bacterium]|nr:trimeric intracellular cation channel family protein [Candidatus Caenarcaniphilales bacterium]